MTITAADSVRAFNASREPERRSLKYKAMRANAFVFLRGTCHLFHERSAEAGLAPDGAPVWICGDLHLENFGTYLGDNALTYFDINDFDEALLAPHTFDVMRLATSLLVAAPVLGLNNGAAKAMTQRLIESYLGALQTGKPLWIERRTATGLIGVLMDGLKKREPAKFLAKRTRLDGGQRTLIIDGQKTLALDPADRKPLALLMKDVAVASKTAPAFKLLDAARRVAGTGSLGVARYVLLIEGDGGGANWLLDLKAATSSAVTPHVAIAQPAWPNEAERVVKLQTLLQINSPGLFSAHTYREQPFVLKQMQPSADRLDLAAAAEGEAASFTNVLDTMAQLTAWSHLRGTGRYGAATADALIASANTPGRAADLMARAQDMARITLTDWAQYSAAFDAGTFNSG
jgi:uncharacterized protein (DUF2252 family)